MANYINSEILCEAYTHLNVEDVTEDAKAKLKHDLTHFMTERAQFLLGSDIRIEVEFEDGSLITKLKVIGAAGAVMFSLASDYGSFRDGVSNIARDVTTLTQAANLEVMFRTRANYCSRINIESRKGVFGRVDSLIKELDALKEKINDTELPTNATSLKSFELLTDNLLAWDAKASKLFEKFGSSNTVVCISTGLLDELKVFPASPPWRETLNSKGNIRVQTLEADPKLEANVYAAMTRFERSLQAIRRQMKERLEQASSQLS